jgi:hypothetical protein
MVNVYIIRMTAILNVNLTKIRMLLHWRSGGGTGTVCVRVVVVVVVVTEGSSLLFPMEFH